MTFVAVVLLCMDIRFFALASFIIYCAAGATDWFDGYLARKYNIVTTFGKFMDALSDKIMVVSMFMALFAFATVLCWAHYGQESLRYLTDRHGVATAHLIAVSLSAFLGAVAAPAVLWDLTDLVLALLTLLNLPALYLCRDTIFAGTRQFFNRKKTPRQKCRGGETIVLK